MGLFTIYMMCVHFNEWLFGNIIMFTDLFFNKSLDVNDLSVSLNSSVQLYWWMHEAESTHNAFYFGFPFFFFLNMLFNMLVNLFLQPMEY